MDCWEIWSSAINDEGVCRTAPVTPGLLKTSVNGEKATLNKKLYHSKRCYFVPDRAILMSFMV